MKYLHVCLWFALFHSVQTNAQSQLNRPKLVVGIVVDQLRWDYLYRYYDKYSEDGFKKLMSKGHNCQNTFINYLPTFTGPGHACIYTGSVPAIHGIAANDWLSKKTNKIVYCVQDECVMSIGGSFRAGQMSPANLLTTTITDELRLATNMQSKVFGVSIKDRGSILPAGHLANGAFWFDDSTGNFMTSSYYGSSFPGWLTKFNGKKSPATYIKSGWDLLYVESAYEESLTDNNNYEAALPGEKDPVFPHSALGMKDKGYKALRYLPAGNTIVFDMGLACIKGEDLGKDYIADFLCLSFSSTDYAGHSFTSNSVEMEDMLLRFDNDLAAFLRYLDKEIGKDAYTVFLTSDHGAAHNAQYMQDLHLPAGLLDEHTLQDRLEDFLQEKFDGHHLIKMVVNYQVYLQEDVIREHKLDREEVKQAIVDWLKQQDGIAFVADMDDMDDAIIPEPIRTWLVNSYHSKRSGCIQFINEAGWYSDESKKGTTHGTWNPYDSHIPLLWYGWGIKPGNTYRHINMTDIAPTLSALLHIQMPNGNIGQVIEEVIK